MQPADALLPLQTKNRKIIGTAGAGGHHHQPSSPLPGLGSVSQPAFLELDEETLANQLVPGDWADRLESEYPKGA